MSELSEQISTFINTLLTEDQFVTDIQISIGKGKGKIKILLDGDHGINIDHCAHVSRKLSQFLEEKDFIQHPYTLEVSSHGLDLPIKLKRQYEKNVGRQVRVLLHDQQQVEGKLELVNSDNITLAVKPKSKKAEAEKVGISFDEIESTKVLVSFK